jgi:hypothetical protein
MVGFALSPEALLLDTDTGLSYNQYIKSALLTLAALEEA